MLNKILTVASFATATLAKQQVATFDGSNGITGTVTVDYGSVTINLDLSGDPDLPYGFENCTDGGLKYHIHEYWDYDNDTMTEGIGSECGGAFTGSHYDPWAACGSATGNTYCSGKGGCIDSTYSCDMDDDPYSCEIGDWSSKYGLAEVDDDYISSVSGSAFYEVIPSDIEGMSVVFHCTTPDGDRAFCAVFEEGDDAEEEVPDQDDIDVVAYFDVLSDESQITLFQDGTINVQLDISDDNDEVNLDDFSCSTFEYTIWTINTDGFEDGTSLYGTTACSGVLMDSWDPTNQCQLSELSSSEYCDDSSGLLCDDADYSYNCNFNNDRFSCAPGDLSGKFSTFDSSASLTIETDGPRTLTPPNSVINGEAIAIHCPYTSGGDLEILACAEIMEYEMPDTPTTTSDNGVAQMSIISVSFVSLIAVLF